MQSGTKPAKCEADTWHWGSYFNLPLIPAYSDMLSQWVDVENHLHRISGSQMIASYSLFHVIPDNNKKDAEGCAAASANFRDTTLSPGYFWLSCPSASRLIIFPPKEQTQAPLNGWSRGLSYTERGGGGGRAHCERGEGLAPNLGSSCVHGDTMRFRDGAITEICRLESRDSLVCFRAWLIWSLIPFFFLLIPGHPEFQFGTVAPGEGRGLIHSQSQLLCHCPQREMTTSQLTQSLLNHNTLYYHIKNEV